MSREPKASFKAKPKQVDKLYINMDKARKVAQTLRGERYGVPVEHDRLCNGYATQVLDRLAGNNMDARLKVIQAISETLEMAISLEVPTVNQHGRREVRIGER